MTFFSLLQGGDRDDVLMPPGYKMPGWDLIVSTFTINILSLALPVMTLQVYDRILPNPGSGTLPVLIAGVCIAVFLETLLRLGRAYQSGWLGASYEHRLSCRALKHFLQSDLAQPVSYGIGEYMNKMAAIGRLKDFYNGVAAATVLELLFVPLFLLLIVYIAGPLSFIPVAVLMIFTAVSYAQGKALRAALSARDDTDDARYNFLIETLEGIHTVKSFGVEKIFCRKYEYLEEKSTRANFKVTEESARTFDTGTVFSAIMMAGIIGGGSYLVLANVISTGALIATLLLSGRIMLPVQRALGLWARYQDYAVSRKKAESLFDIPLHPATTVQATAPEREGTLSFENVSFRRGEDNAWILKNTSLNLSRGECVSLTSNDAEGLSGVLGLMAGLYAPETGTVLIDGRNSLSYTPENLASHVGYIHGEAVIFRGTIRDNLTCFGKIPQEMVQEMCALFRLDKEIARLPSGFDTFLSGNDTDTIPPGLKQRISIVRTLAPKPRIILFDNADKSLDREGYNLLYNLFSLLSGKATIILSTDDKNLSSFAARRLHIEQSEISETSPRFKNERKNLSYRELSI